MSHYSRGYQFEQRCKKQLERAGWYVIRSAGSHGLVDICSLRQGEVMLLQLSIPGYKSPRERDQLRELAKENKCRAFIVSRGDKHTNFRIMFEELED